MFYILKEYCTCLLVTGSIFKTDKNAAHIAFLNTLNIPDLLMKCILCTKDISKHAGFSVKIKHVNNQGLVSWYHPECYDNLMDVLGS